MKILAIGEQVLVLLTLKKQLINLGYYVVIESNISKGLDLFDSFAPDLVLVDINLNEIFGLNIIRNIRLTKNSQSPIVVLSSSTCDKIITKSFELGINDYMKKPLSLNEICVRIKKLIGVPLVKNSNNLKNEMIINKRCVGVVIPCYNEEDRLFSSEFITFLNKNSGYHLCFVNDGSNDKTLNVLHKIQKGREDFITVYDCEKNGGKAEAVRLGMLHMAKKRDLDYIGFLDADLSTNLADFDDLVKTIEVSNFKIVCGSRISRMGADISKESARKIISLSINFVIRKILSMDFKDTQCGAKIFHKDIIQIAFRKKFVTQWIFDVEIFMRMRRHFSLNTSLGMFYEQPLKRWIHADGSKLSMKDSIKIMGQLAQIAWVYRTKKVNVDYSNEMKVA